MQLLAPPSTIGNQADIIKPNNDTGILGEGGYVDHLRTVCRSSSILVQTPVSLAKNTEKCYAGEFIAGILAGVLLHTLLHTRSLCIT